MSTERFRKGRQCAGCGAAVSDRGPNSKSGEYFCSGRDCRSLRDSRRQSESRTAARRAVALSVSLEIERERQRDRHHVERLRAAGMKDFQIQRQFPELRL